MASSSREALLTLRRQAWELHPTPLLHLRAARSATLSTWRYGSSVPGVRRDEQWRQQIRLRVQCRLSFDSYYRYRLYDPARAADAPAFLELEEMITLRGWLDRRRGLDREALADKRKFHDRAVAAGLPTPPVLAAVAGGQIVHAPSRLPDHDLFVKEAHALCGQGAAYWTWDGDGAYASASGERVPKASFLERLAAQSDAPYLVQPRLANHPAIAPLSAGGLCTMRVITSRSPDTEPIVLRACFRMPRGRAAADNFAQGGVASPVDLETGRLGPAVQKALPLAGASLDNHPTTDARISGFVLPLYAQGLALAIRAHQVFGEFSSVGWDIALTPQGPVVIEGNHNWDTVLAQQPHGRSLASTAFAEHFWAFVESSGRRAGTPEEPAADLQPRGNGGSAVGKGDVRRH